MKLNELKVVFFGTSDFAVPILDTLISHTNVVGVVTQSDKPVGRKKEITSTPIAKYCQISDVKCQLLKFKSIKDEESYNILQSLDADIFIVAAYGNIIPNRILDIPQYKSLNVHGSILPHYRGASPIHEALKNGDVITGNTIMLMDEKMDHGPVFASSEVSITNEDDFKSLEGKMAVDGAKILIKILEKYISGEITPTEQDHDNATYVSLINKSDGEINWYQSAKEIYNQWRAYIQWPGVYTSFNSKGGDYVNLSLEVLKIADSDLSIAPGVMQFVNGTVFVGTSEGAIELIELTPQGKNKMDARSFINGHAYLDQTTLGQ